MLSDEDKQQVDDMIKHEMDKHVWEALTVHTPIMFVVLFGILIVWKIYF